MNQTKVIWGVIVAVALVFSGYLWYNSQKAKTQTIPEQTIAAEPSPQSAAPIGISAEEQTSDQNQVDEVELDEEEAVQEAESSPEHKKVLDYLAANINSVAPEKAKHQKWVIDEVDFVNANNAYVLYYDTVEDDDNSDIDEDTEKEMLLEINPAASGFETKIIAYFELGEEDFVLKSGSDKYADEDTTDYQYDPETKTWESLN